MSLAPAPISDNPHLDRPLGHLDGVESGSLAEIVAHDPERDPVSSRGVAPDPADEDVVLPGDLGGCRVDLALWVVLDPGAGRRREKLAHPSGAALVGWLD